MCNQHGPDDLASAQGVVFGIIGGIVLIIVAAVAYHVAASFI